MREKNRFDWANKPTFIEHPIMERQEKTESHDFYIEYDTGILYRRRSVSVRRLFSTA